MSNTSRTFKIKTVGGSHGPRWRQYAGWVVGKSDLYSLVKYELITGLFGNLPGALGLYIRGKVYRLILGSVGRNVVFGRSITLRHPHKIHIGSDVLIDDHCMLDAKGDDNAGIAIGDHVFIGRNSIVYCKNGDIEIQPHVNISFNCEIFSSQRVTIGRGTIIAAYCYIMSGGSYDYAKGSKGFAEQDGFAKGPTTIGEGCWLGARATVLDGISVGPSVVLGAGAVVTRDLPCMVVATGVPARIASRQTGINRELENDQGSASQNKKVRARNMGAGHDTGAELVRHSGRQGD